MGDIYAENIGNGNVVETADFESFVLQKIYHFRQQLGNQLIPAYSFIMKRNVFVGGNGVLKQIVCQAFDQIGILPGIFNVLCSLLLRF